MFLKSCCIVEGLAGVTYLILCCLLPVSPYGQIAAVAAAIVLSVSLIMAYDYSGLTYS